MALVYIRGTAAAIEPFLMECPECGGPLVLMEEWGHSVDGKKNVTGFSVMCCDDGCPFANLSHEFQPRYGTVDEVLDRWGIMKEKMDGG